MSILIRMVNWLPLLAVSGLVLGVSDVQAAPAAELAVVVQPEKAQYRVGEPVILRCIFSNGLDEPVELDFGDFEVTNIWYVAGDGTPGAVTRSFSARRGGGPMQWPVTLQPAASAIRYSVLDMWYRADVVGTVPMRLIVKTAGRWVTGRFNLHVVGPVAAEDLRGVVNALVAKGASNHEATGFEMMERRSCDEAVLYALSYLGDAPVAVWEDAVKHFCRAATCVSASTWRE